MGAVNRELGGQLLGRVIVGVGTIYGVCGGHEL